MRTQSAIDDLIADRRAAGCSSHTIASYTSKLAKLARREPELPMEPAPLRSLLAAQTGAPSSRHALFRALRALYRFLELDRQISAADNPMHRVTAPRVPKTKPRTLDRRDVTQLLATPVSARDRAILTLILDCSVRSGELRSLHARDLHDGYIQVRGKSGERLVPVHADTLDQLRARVADPDDLVFTTVDGRPLTQYRVYLIVRAALGRAGLDRQPKHGPHLLRHTFGRHWMSAGGDLVALQAILGHASIETTRIYAELAPEEVISEHSEHSTLTRPPSLRRVI